MRHFIKVIVNCIETALVLETKDENHSVNPSGKLQEYKKKGWV